MIAWWLRARCRDAQMRPCRLRRHAVRVFLCPRWLLRSESGARRCHTCCYCIVHAQRTTVPDNRCNAIGNRDARMVYKYSDGCSTYVQNETKNEERKEIGTSAVRIRGTMQRRMRESDPEGYLWNTTNRADDMNWR
ncbi:hypothetical protein PHLGIDRAFT_137869 [Phlebiopsis gigantea 11061_1 CR5-6]|uniref:Uncharacterized protein n=1 Tax=Phlebiopsis gigantea (strain 11061_1 CR5-6) TaxID=745531 RepID=A0A0C3PXK4_PHLG1|nr:hypothetical protein PHLGIDRAFT_137869 [Phlebiopsis gigantea 11061_1 CR5-6]